MKKSRRDAFAEYVAKNQARESAPKDPWVREKGKDAYASDEVDRSASLSEKSPIAEEKVEYSMAHTTGFRSIFLPKYGRKPHFNRHMFVTCMIVVLLFAGLIGHMVHFMIKDSATIIANPYNQRTEILKKQIIRGKIYSRDGKILAQTLVDEEGNERREYPFHRLFSHVIGYASHGKGGLEGVYNYELMSSHIDILTQTQNQISSIRNPGDSLVTTLDTDLQQAAYDALGDHQGAIVAIEPSSGKIRAMVSKPDFDPNTLDDIWNDIVNDDSSSVLLNRSTQGLYPPGSTYKVITGLEFLMEHPDDYKDFTYKCKGETVVDSVRIKCFEKNKHGKENLEDAFRNSCNTAFVTLGSTLDRKKFIDLNHKLLFNKEISGDLKTAASRFMITGKTPQSSMPQTVIGQGDTLMTPLHNALIMCGIANDGTIMRPMLAAKIMSDDNVTVKSYDSHALYEMDESMKESLPTLKKYLRKVVTDGTGHALKNDSYTVAGKTGSAENEKENAHSWFVGYSNVDNPELVVCVIAENAGSGSKVAAPMARKVFDAYYLLK